MQQHLKKISHFPIFSNFKKTELQIILDNSFTKTLEKNNKLFAIHEKRDVFFIVLEGEIEIERELGESEEIVEIVTEGEYIAEHSLFNPKAMHSHTAKVHSQKAVVLGIPGKLFAKLPLKTAHKLLLNLLPIISDNFSHASNRMMTILKTGEILGRQTKDVGELGNAILKIMLQAIKTNKALIALKIANESQAQIRSLQGFKKL